MNQKLQNYELVDKKKLKKLIQSEKISEEYNILSNENKSLTHEFKTLKQNYGTLSESYAQEVKSRKEYLNKLQDLEGNIRVFCRLRPVQPIDMNTSHDKSIPNTTKIVHITDAYSVKFIQQSDLSEKQFTFDSCFPESTSQTDIFSACENLLKSGMDG